MIAKKILFGKNARDQIKVGIDTAADVAKVTIGPRGRNVMVDRGIMPPEITNDGLNAIRTIVLQDRVHNMGVDLVKDVAVKTNDKAKGARTASIILMQSIFNEGMDYMEQGYNAIAIKRAIEKGAASVIEKLKSRAILVSKQSEIEAVATISSESAEIGKVVAEVVNKVGVDGVVTVEESPITSGIVSDYTEGMKIDKGWIHPGFVNNFNKMEAEYENIPVILINRKMIQITDFLPLQEQLANNGMGEVLIIVEDMEGEALETLVANNLRGGFKTVVIKSPGFGVEKAEILKDIAIATGATIISEESGNPLKLAKLDSVGFAKRIVVGRNSTILVSGPTQKNVIEARITQLKEQLETLESKTDRANMESRIAKMSEGVGVIKVGAATESGIKYLKMKIDDAVNEAKNAMQEGFIAGGGTEFVKIAGVELTPKQESLLIESNVKHFNENPNEVKVAAHNSAVKELTKEFKDKLPLPSKEVLDFRKKMFATFVKYTTSKGKSNKSGARNELIDYYLTKLENGDYTPADIDNIAYWAATHEHGNLGRNTQKTKTSYVYTYPEIISTSKDVATKYYESIEGYTPSVNESPVSKFQNITNTIKNNPK